MIKAATQFRPGVNQSEVVKRDRLLFDCAAVFLIIIFIASAGYSFLPDKYYYDGLSLQARLSGVRDAASMNDASFENVADIYLFLGLNADTPFLFNASLGCAWATTCLLLSRFPLGLERNFRFYLYAVPLFICYVIYMGQLSKEHVALFVILCMSNRFTPLYVALGIGLAFIVLYIIYFRAYWGAVLALWFLLLVFHRRYDFGWKNIPYIILILLGLSLYVSIFRGYFITDLRFDVNINREGSLDAATMILPGNMATSSLMDVFNIIKGYLTIAFPVYLFKTLNPLHAFFGVFGTFLTIAMLRAGILLCRAEVNKNDLIYKYLFLFWFSYTVIQGAFEPDFGSFLKHQSVFFPIVSVVLWKWSQLSVKNRKKGGGQWI